MILKCQSFSHNNNKTSILIHLPKILAYEENWVEEDSYNPVKS